MKKVRLLKNGRYAGYLKQKDGKWKYSFISNKIGGLLNNNYESIGNYKNNTIVNNTIVNNNYKKKENNIINNNIFSNKIGQPYKNNYNRNKEEIKKIKKLTKQEKKDKIKFLKLKYASKKKHNLGFQNIAYGKIEKFTNEILEEEPNFYKKMAKNLAKKKIKVPLKEPITIKNKFEKSKKKWLVRRKDCNTKICKKQINATQFFTNAFNKILEIKNAERPREIQHKNNKKRQNNTSQPGNQRVEPRSASLPARRKNNTSQPGNQRVEPRSASLPARRKNNTSQSVFQRVEPRRKTVQPEKKQNNNEKAIQNYIKKEHKNINSEEQTKKNKKFLNNEKLENKKYVNDNKAKFYKPLAELIKLYFDVSNTILDNKYIPCYTKVLEFFYNTQGQTKGEQQDSQEFLSFINTCINKIYSATQNSINVKCDREKNVLKQFENNFKTNKLEELLGTIFATEYNIKKQCVKVKFEKKLIINLEVSENLKVDNINKYLEEKKEKLEHRYLTDKKEKYYFFNNYCLIQLKVFLVKKNQSGTYKIKPEIKNISENIKNTNGDEYELMGVVVHRGTSMNSGHYMAYVKRNNIVYKCDDRIITSGEQFNNIPKNETPYILLYKKVSHNKSDEQIKPKGIQNWNPFSFICFANASLQLLFTIPEIKDLVEV